MKRILFAVILGLILVGGTAQAESEFCLAARAELVQAHSSKAKDYEIKYREMFVRICEEGVRKLQLKEEEERKCDAGCKYSRRVYNQLSAQQYTPQVHENQSVVERYPSETNLDFSLSQESERERQLHSQREYYNNQLETERRAHEHELEVMKRQQEGKERQKQAWREEERVRQQNDQQMFWSDKNWNKYKQ